MRSLSYHATAKLMRFIGTFQRPSVETRRESIRLGDLAERGAVIGLMVIGLPTRKPEPLLTPQAALARHAGLVPVGVAHHAILGRRKVVAFVLWEPLLW